MKVALALVDYFPHGGAQRACARIAAACVARGHAVRLYVSRARGAPPTGVAPARIGRSAWTNHGRVATFARALRRSLTHEPADVVVGFNCLPGLDVLYAADPCFAARGRLRDRVTRRGRVYRRLERAAFDASAGAPCVLVLTRAAQAEYRARYGTPAERFLCLPPEIAADRLPATNPRDVRRRVRNTLAVADDELLLVQIAAQFGTKGVDRTLRALRAVSAHVRPRVRLMVVGGDRAAPYRRLARRLGIAARVIFLGARDDVAALLQAADLMVHPARREAAGAVLLEALAAGLPVITTAVCGHAPGVREAGAGRVVDEPFRQCRLDAALAAMLAPAARAEARIGAGAWFEQWVPGRDVETAVAAIEAAGETR